MVGWDGWVVSFWHKTSLYVREATFFQQEATISQKEATISQQEATIGCRMPVYDAQEPSAESHEPRGGQPVTAVPPLYPANDFDRNRKIIGENVGGLHIFVYFCSRFAEMCLRKRKDY